MWVEFRDLIQVDLQRAEAIANEALARDDLSTASSAFAQWGRIAIPRLSEMRRELADIRRSVPNKNVLDQFNRLLGAYEEAAVLHRDGALIEGLRSTRDADVLWEEWLQVIGGRP